MREIAIEVDVHVGGALVRRVQLPARSIDFGGPESKVPLPEAADGARFALRFDGEEVLFLPEAGVVRWGPHALERPSGLGRGGSITVGGAAIYFRLIEGGGELRLWPEPVVLHDLRVGATSRFYGTRLLYGPNSAGRLRMWDGVRLLPPRLGPDLEELRRLAGERLPQEVASYIARELYARFRGAPPGARLSFALSRVRIDWSGAIYDLAFPEPGLYTPPAPNPSPREPAIVAPTPGSKTAAAFWLAECAFRALAPDGPLNRTQPVTREEAAAFVSALFPDEHRRDRVALDALESLSPPD